MDTLGVDVNDSGNSAAQIHVSYLFTYLSIRGSKNKLKHFIY